MSQAPDILQECYEIIRERWVNGIQEFKEVALGGEDEIKNRYGASTSKLITEPLHGIMTVDVHDLALIDSYYFQRLKYISQLGAAFHVYPGGSYSRFLHSLGVFNLANVTCNVLTRRRKIPMIESFFANFGEKALSVLKAAALLHDIGHGPFSHFTDMVKGKIADDERVGKAKYHEKRARDMILDKDPVLYRLLGEDGKKLYISEYLKNVYKLNRDEIKAVAEMITGESHFPLTKLVNSALDLDKMDYLLRDSHFTGIPFGRAVNYEYILKKIEVGLDLSTNHWIVGFNERAFDSIMQVVNSREYMFPSLGFHHVTKISEAMVWSIVYLSNFLFLIHGGEEEKIRFFDHLELMVDRDLLTCLEMIGKRFSKDVNYGYLGKLIYALVRRYEDRVLHKRSASYSYREMLTLGRKKPYPIFEIFDVPVILLPADFFNQKDPELAKKLAEHHSIVIIYVSDCEKACGDITKMGDRIKESIFKDADDIHLFHANEPISLISYLETRCEGGTIEYFDALRRMRLDHWNILVLAPPELRGDVEHIFQNIENFAGLYKEAKSWWLEKFGEVP